MAQLSLFDSHSNITPCPIREWCGAFHCETGGCTGERGWCSRAKKTAFEPADCPLAIKTAMKGKKSFCKPWGRWTNCREVGRCLYVKYRNEC